MAISLFQKGGDARSVYRELLRWDDFSPYIKNGRKSWLVRETKHGRIGN